jgi:membrane-associated phospholipid phosphatase
MERRRESSSTMFERRIHALVAGVVVFAFGILLCVAIAADPTASPVQRFDDRWLTWMSDLRSPWLTRAAKGMSFLGGPLVTVPLRVTVVAALACRRRWLQLAAFVAVTVSSELCIGPLKAVVDRPRPPGSLIETSGASCPSGHAIAGAVTAFGLVVVLLPASPRRWVWIGGAAAFAGLMATSRTYLGAHWLSDVGAGVCLGTGLALALPAALELGRDRYNRRSNGSARSSPTGVQTAANPQLPRART